MIRTGSRVAVKVLDGGLGTDLEICVGEDLLKHPLWSAHLLKDNPTAIKESHKRFLVAGSDAVVTASYQASVQGFMKYFKLTKEEAGNLVKYSVDIAKEAIKEVQSECGIERKLYVAASIGPYGATLHDMSEYSGNYVDSMTMEQLKDWHRERISLLLSREPDYLAIETMPAAKEVFAILDVLKEFPNAKAWVTFTCKDSKTTFHNDDVVETVKTVSKNPQVKSIGVNCCRSEIVGDLITSINKLLSPEQTIIVYPNTGLKFQDGRWVDCKSDDISHYALAWLESGAVEWIGGCCKVSPKHIFDISKIAAQYNA